MDIRYDAEWIDFVLPVTSSLCSGERRFLKKIVDDCNEFNWDVIEFFALPFIPNGGEECSGELDSFLFLTCGTRDLQLKRWWHLLE